MPYNILIHKKTRCLYQTKKSDNSKGNEMTTRLVDDYVNFIMDSMCQKIKEETLYDYLVNEYKDLSEKELTQQILENYGDEWFEYVKENN